MASRAKKIEQLQMKSRNWNPDGVLIYSLYGEKRDKVLLVRQYRYSIDDYIYEFPAGLVDPGRELSGGCGSGGEGGDRAYPASTCSGRDV